MPTGSPRRLRDARRDEESERRKHQRGEDDRASGEQVHEGLLTRMGPLIQVISQSGTIDSRLSHF
jgi:hypothetical protein